MTGIFWFDWLLLALSLANGILLLWLGLTVLLNAERRTFGVALLALAAWLGSAFFAAHTAILASGEGPASAALSLWWELGWLPLLALPLAWYGVVLWYSGFGGDTGLRRHRWPLLLVGSLFVGLAAALFVAAGLPSFLDAVNLRFDRTATLFGAPWFLLLYPVYILACLGLVFDALLRPAPPPTRQRATARNRARPWLLAANMLLLLVGALVALIMTWVARTPAPAAADLFGSTLSTLDIWAADPGSTRSLALGIAWTDLLVSALLTGVIGCISYALVQYEVFSGRTLPRRALRQHWRAAWLLAAGYGVAVGAALAAGWRPVYSLLLTALLMTLFFALLGWRTFAAQTAFVRRLQPFVVSTHLVEELITQVDTSSCAATPQDAGATFAALCTEVLQTDYAALVATGALAALVERPLVYPANALAPTTLPAPSHAQQDELAIPIDEPSLPQVAWALPILGTQGAIGVMLLGRRRGNGLYAEEEIAIARATGERLLDLLAAAALARRLLGLARQQWAEGQVADRQTRRVLHDEVLPDLHAALIMLGEGDNPQTTEARELLATAHRQTAALLRGLPARPPVRPSGHLLDDLRRLVEEEMASRFDAVQFGADAAAATIALQMRPLSAEVIFYAVRELVRNAGQHGRGQGDQPLTLIVSIQGAPDFTVTVEDNGVGEAAGSGGAGQGLALHAAMLAVVGCTLEVQPVPEGGMQATIQMAVE